MDTNMELVTQAWFKKPTPCSLSHGKEKNTSESLEFREAYMILASLSPCFFL
jgi:hypothetical protein